MRPGQTPRLEPARWNKHAEWPVKLQGYAMNSIRRSLVPILWLVSMTASGAPVGDPGGPDVVKASNPSAKALEGQGASAADEDVMRRVRVLIEELKRQGPPPVDCMEG